MSLTPSPPSTPRPHLLVGGLLLTLLTLLNGLLWAHVIPFGRAPDERAHFALASFIYLHDRLPILNRDIPVVVVSPENPPDPYATHPPGGYLLSSTLAHLFPGQREDLPLRYGSAFTVALAVPFLLATFALIFPRSAALPLALTSVAVLLPQVTFLSAYINSDAFAVLAGATLFAALAWGHLRAWTWYRCLALGLAAGLVILSRYNAYPLLPVALVTFLVGLYPQRWTRAFLRLSLALAATTALAYPWLAHNQKHYNELLPLKTLESAQTKALGQPFNTFQRQGQSHLDLLTKSTWPRVTFESTLGFFDHLSVGYPQWVYTTGMYVGLTALLGLLAAAALLRRDGSARFLARAPLLPECHPRSPALLLASAASLLALLALSLHLSLTRDFQPQGRYLLPALPALIFLLYSGLRTLIAWARSPRSAHVLAATLAALMLLLNLFALLRVVAPAHPTLPPDSALPQILASAEGENAATATLAQGLARRFGLITSAGSSFRTTLVPSGPYLSLLLGLTPTSAPNAGKVRFVISADDGQSGQTIVLDQLWDPRDPDLRDGFLSTRVDLSRYLNRPILLRLFLDPLDSPTTTQAVWLDPRWSP
jgi:4-amino-4-deoxy-L-arabinose transferase-like glycosyltransferase